MSENAARNGTLTVLLVFGGMFLMFVLFAAMVLAAMGDEGMSGFGAGEKIGIVEVNGPIMESKTAVEAIRKFEKNDNVKGIVVRINSPGGAVAPSQEIFQAVKRAKAKKPLAVSMGSTAASGGYYIAIGADTIFANSGSVTGSIGVITQIFNVSRLTERIELDVHTIKTGPYKDSGSPFRPFDVNDEAYFNNLIDDVYLQFIEDVAAERKMELADVRKVADGRVFTGRQALEHKLVDKLGTLNDAVQFVADEAGIKGDPEMLYPAKDKGFISELMKGSIQSVVSEAKQQSTPLLEYRYLGPQ